MSESAEEFGYGLVMPFVSVVSKGGPHDDASYVAGYECGMIDVELKVCAAVGALPHDLSIHTENVRQVDLIAMHRGYAASFVTNEVAPEWSTVTFTLGETS